MEEDLFIVEQKIYDDAVLYSKELRDGAALDPDKFDKFVKEYGRLLRLLRRATKVSDRTTGTLHTSKIDLLDKVHYDSLTGIYNRRYMEENLSRVIKSVARSDDCLTVMMLDIDFFKKYNDTYGHSEGDACLKAVAQSVTRCLLRPGDFAARYGGEEFAVILPGTDESGGRVMSDKILEAVRLLNIPHEKNEAAACVTISIGFTTGIAEHVLFSGVDKVGEHYIKRADAALYQSKQNGRNRYTYINFLEEESR